MAFSAKESSDWDDDNDEVEEDEDDFDELLREIKR
jgi:hypothetical protein